MIGRRGAGGRYSALIGVGKYMLPAIGVTVLALALLWPNIMSSVERIGRGERVSAESVRNMEATNPRYVGTDEKNRPFKLEAKSAQQLPGNTERVRLVEPKGQMTLENGNWVAVSAKSGEFDQKTRILKLEGDVVVFHDANYTFRTESATVDTAKSAAWGDKPVRASGPKGTIEAQGFRVSEKGEVVTFTGRAKVVLKLDDQDVRELGAPTRAKGENRQETK
jgi:lipopolysaccharide export system protein LptC